LPCVSPGVPGLGLLTEVDVSGCGLGMGRAARVEQPANTHAPNATAISRLSGTIARSR
jgi:hypothetical protein